MFKKKIIIALTLALLLVPFLAIKASGTKTGDSVYIAKDEIVSGNLYVAGKTITVDGVVSGDLIAAAQTIIVNGQVDGDIIAVAQDININGNSGGNIRVAGSSVIINGEATRNINVFASNITITNQSRVGWDALLMGANIQMRGIIDGNLSGGSDQLLISGKIGGNVNVKLSDNYLSQGLIISPETIINGDLNYTSKNTANISDQANIAGKTELRSPTIEKDSAFIAYLWKTLFKIFASFLIGLVLIFLLTKLTQKVLTFSQDSLSKIFIFGLSATLIVPPISILLALTIIGLPLALILFAFWLIMIYLAPIFTAILLGQFIIKKSVNKELKNNFWPLLIGIVILFLLFSIPFVGWILNLIAIFFGLGKLISYANYQSKNI